MVSVNTNIASLQAQSALNGTQGEYETAMQRLSTGKKINGAADDAAGLSVASSMTAQIKGLKMASKNASDGISLVNTIEGALDEATQILQRMRELSVQAISDTNNGSDRTYIQDEINQLNNELNRISSTTQYNGQNVLDGSFTGKSFQIGNLGNQTMNFGVNSMDTTTLGAYQITSVAEATAIAASAAAADTAATAIVNVAADYVLKGFFGTKTAGVDAGANARDTAKAVNLISSDTNIKATAITKAYFTLATAATVTFDLKGKSSTASTVTSTNTAVTDLTATKDAINAVSGSTGITATLNAAKNQVWLTQSEGYNIAISECLGSNMVLMPTDPDDGDTTAVTLATGGDDSSVVFGAVRLSSDKAFTLAAGNAAHLFSGATTAISASLAQLGNVTLKTVVGATNAIAVLDQSLAMVASSRSSMGAIQNRLTSTVSNLNNIATKTEQSMSQIMDADYASETTALSKAQILQQASTAMLAQANQANQGVLRLLQAG